MMRQCLQCGKLVEETDKFCEACGHNLILDEGSYIETEETIELTPQESQLSRSDRSQEKSKSNIQSLIGLALIALSIAFIAGYLVIMSDNNPLSQAVNNWLATQNF